MTAPRTSLCCCSQAPLTRARRLALTRTRKREGPGTGRATLTAHRPRLGTGAERQDTRCRSGDREDRRDRTQRPETDREHRLPDRGAASAQWGKGRLCSACGWVTGARGKERVLFPDSHRTRNRWRGSEVSVRTVRSDHGLTFMVLAGAPPACPEGRRGTVGDTEGTRGRHSGNEQISCRWAHLLS